MFRQRTSSQKPADDLLANFRQQFPEVAASPTSGAGQLPVTTQTAGNIIPIPVAGQETTQQQLNQSVFPDQDPTPRASSNEPWRFTPSLLDSSAFSFPAFSHNNAGTYYAPAPGGNNSLFHPPGGDLHTSALGMDMGLNTTLSLPTTDGTLLPSAGQPAMIDVSASAYNNSLHPQAFHAYNSFPQPAPQQAALAPSTFIQQDAAFGALDHGATGLGGATQPVGMAAPAAPAGFSTHPVNLVAFSSGQAPHTQVVNGAGTVTNMGLLTSLPPTAEKFRFHTTLNAPTAMIKHADEIPVSYLNKGQAYSISIIDTEPELPIVPDTRFRTYIRISFEDEQQRQKPGVCWSLWKEGRGTNEAHQRGGKLQAVEYVEAGQPPDGDEKRTRVELESASFDGFSVIWTPGVQGAVECNLAVRFNFLSTDFSHSKGVKGIPVRLCAKTTRHPAPQANVPPTSPKDASASSIPPSEICFCKVKLFRDHGAERKLSNDIAHVKKTIEKLKQQIAQAESGMKDLSKRKRVGGAVVVAPKSSADLQRMGKAPKHKRTWSMSSTSSAGNNGTGSGVEDMGSGNNIGGAIANRANGGNGGNLAVEEDLHCKLQTLQDMFTSTRPVSILYLRGDEFDDPDLHPVSLSGEPQGSLAKVESRDNLMAWRDQSSHGSMVNSSMVSPSPSSLSLHSQVSLGGNGANGTNGMANGWSDYHGDQHGDHVDAQSGTRQGSNQPIRVGKTNDTGNLSGWIEALDVDSSYRPRPSDKPKPAACFYVLRRNGPQPQGGGNGNSTVVDGAAGGRDLHRAVYLTKRTVQEFANRLASKWNLDPSRVARTVRVLPQGLEVELDDDAIVELPEGQDMVLDVVEVPLPLLNDISAQNVKKEWEMSLDSDGDAGGRVAYELRLSF